VLGKDFYCCFTSRILRTRMEIESVTRKYYSRLFLLPKAPVLMLLYIVLLAIVALINSVPPLSFSRFLVSFTQYLILGVALALMYSPLAVAKTLTLKRTLGIAAAMFLVALPAEVIFYRLLSFKGVGLLASSGFTFIILMAFCHPLIALTSSVALPLLAFKTVNDLLGEFVSIHNMVYALMTTAMSVGLGALFLILIEVKGRNLGYSPITVARAFIKTWFTGDPVKLEEAFSKYGKIEDLRTKILILNRVGGEPIVLIFPTLHFGPFRNIGSSRFIYHLEDALGTHVKSFVFHTAGSHEHNLVSSEDSVELAKKLNVLINNYYSTLANLKMCEPMRIKVRGWSAYVLRGPTLTIVFLVNTEKGSDDLPHELWGYLESRLGDLLVTAVVDSHSFKGEKVSDLRELKGVINEVARKCRCEVGKDFMVGYGEGTINGKCTGVCHNVVKALTMNFSGRRYAIVYIYGNNMDGKYRVKLEEMIKKLGFVDVEIVTPDDHSCAASLTETPYDIVREEEEVTKAVLEAIREAVSNELKTYYSTLEAVIKNVKYVGHSIFNMAKGLGKLGSLTERVLPLLVILMNVTPIVMFLSK